MKALIIIFNIFIILAACTNNKIDGNGGLADSNAALLRENDSLKKLLADTQDTVFIEQPKVEKSSRPVIVQNGKGRHPITLQWISWDKPGYVDVAPLSEGWYTISGSQASKNGNEYLKIDGKIRKLSEKELEFDGIIETLISSNNNGEVCKKEGKQTFYAKGNRKYFRLQNMTNCEGGMLVDYVDIYPGTSGLLN